MNNSFKDDYTLHVKLGLALKMAPEFRTLVRVRLCIYFNEGTCPSVSVLNFLIQNLYVRCTLPTDSYFF